MSGTQSATSKMLKQADTQTLLLLIEHVLQESMYIKDLAQAF
jgi:hypothetical protein